MTLAPVQVQGDQGSHASHGTGGTRRSRSRTERGSRQAGAAPRRNSPAHPAAPTRGSPGVTRAPRTQRQGRTRLFLSRRKDRFRLSDALGNECRECSTERDLVLGDEQKRPRMQWHGPFKPFKCWRSVSCNLSPEPETTEAVYLNLNQYNSKKGHFGGTGKMKSKGKRRKIPPANPCAGSPARLLLLDREKGELVPTPETPH
ncbi:PREDICTED: uncharacterized protein LOC106629024 [Pseudopodoces humilis]|uniref:uncharacterized protein LOC106629024 n=1 Tax=Pseudopodoces humilis TaxID=181119 RepID=UPI0006B80303|nr:PREDICTED: uncharacterized protein LOC106629024 [Pseudopodoces humilis]